MLSSWLNPAPKISTVYVYTRKSEQFINTLMHLLLSVSLAPFSHLRNGVNHRLPSLPRMVAVRIREGGSGHVLDAAAYGKHSRSITCCYGYRKPA